MRTVLKILLPCLAALCCGGCLLPRIPAPVIYYYTLEYDPPQPTSTTPLPAALMVQPFFTNSVYNSRQIVCRDAAYARDASVYHQWRSRPGDLVADMIRRDLQHAGLFQAVVGPGSTVHSRYVLEGTVDEFLASEQGGTREAVLGITITLLDVETSDTSSAVLLQKSYQTRQICHHKGIPALVAAMSSALAEVSLRLGADIAHAVQRAPKAP